MKVPGDGPATPTTLPRHITYQPKPRGKSGAPPQFVVNFAIPSPGGAKHRAYRHITTKGRSTAEALALATPVFLGRRTLLLSVIREENAIVIGY